MFNLSPFIVMKLVLRSDLYSSGKLTPEWDKVVQCFLFNIEDGAASALCSLSSTADKSHHLLRFCRVDS